MGVKVIDNYKLPSRSTVILVVILVVILLGLLVFKTRTADREIAKLDGKLEVAKAHSEAAEKERKETLEWTSDALKTAQRVIDKETKVQDELRNRISNLDRENQRLKHEETEHTDRFHNQTSKIATYKDDELAESTVTSLGQAYPASGSSPEQVYDIRPIGSMGGTFALNRPVLESMFRASKEVLFSRDLIAKKDEQILVWQEKSRTFEELSISLAVSGERGYGAIADAKSREAEQWKKAFDLAEEERDLYQAQVDALRKSGRWNMLKDGLILVGIGIGAYAIGGEKGATLAAGAGTLFVLQKTF